MSRESKRVALETLLRGILGSDNVYFQPPASISLSYPCIIYSFEDDFVLYADDKKYLDRDKYSIQLITKDPLPEELMDKLASIPHTRFDRHYVADNLHHFTYTTESFERY